MLRKDFWSGHFFPKTSQQLVKRFIITFFYFYQILFTSFNRSIASVSQDKRRSVGIDPLCTLHLPLSWRWYLYEKWKQCVCKLYRRNIIDLPLPTCRLYPPRDVPANLRNQHTHTPYQKAWTCRLKRCMRSRAIFSSVFGSTGSTTFVAGGRSTV